MAMSNASTLITSEAARFSEEQRALITNVLCKGATSLEVEFFLQVANRCRLDPFKNQIYAVKRWDPALQKDAMTFQVGIGGLRAIADRTGKYAGNDDPTFIVDEKTGKPIKATCTVYKIVEGQRVGFTASVFYSECVQTKKGGDPNSMWAKRPFGQLGKCAEAQALRKAFPEDTSGLYTPEEIDEDDNPGSHAPHTSSPISDYPNGRAAGRMAGEQEPDSEPVEEAQIMDHWSLLLPDNWRNVKIQSGPYAKWAMMGVVQDAEASKWAASNLDPHSLEGMALFASRWIRIERVLAGIGMDTKAFEAELLKAGLLVEGQSVFDVRGEFLGEFYKFAKSMQEKPKGTEPNRPTQDQPN